MCGALSVVHIFGKVSDTDENGNEEEYLSSLRVLNETVTSWVAEHVKKNPCCVLTPIFSDYEKHLKTLEEKRKSKKSPAPQVHAHLIRNLFIMLMFLSLNTFPWIDCEPKF